MSKTDEAVVRFTIDGEIYESGRATIGDLRLVKKHYGVVNLGAIDDGDPDAIAGLLFLAVKHTKPEWEIKRVINFVDEVSDLDVEVVAPDPKVPAKKSGK